MDLQELLNDLQGSEISIDDYFHIADDIYNLQEKQEVTLQDVKKICNKYKVACYRNYKFLYMPLGVREDT